MSDTAITPTSPETAPLNETSLDDLIRQIRDQLDRMRQDGREIERLKKESLSIQSHTDRLLSETRTLLAGF